MCRFQFFLVCKHTRKAATIESESFHQFLMPGAFKIWVTEPSQTSNEIHAQENVQLHVRPSVRPFTSHFHSFLSLVDVFLSLSFPFLPLYFIIWAWISLLIWISFMFLPQSLHSFSFSWSHIESFWFSWFCHSAVVKMHLNPNLF